MLFKVTQKNGRDVVSQETIEDKASADAIENWSSRFTDKPRTKYGMKITLEYVRGLSMGEVGRFKQPQNGPTSQEFIIERVG